MRLPSLKKVKYAFDQLEVHLSIFTLIFVVVVEILRSEIRLKGGFLVKLSKFSIFTLGGTLV